MALMVETSESQSALDETLKDVMSTLLFAGYDTTSTTLMYALYLLANHPDIQDRCVKEVSRLDESNLSNPHNMPYIAAVVKETLRLYPPGFQTTRTLSKDMVLSGGLVAPKGTHVSIPIWIIQRDPTIFPFPDEFRPERWVRKRSTTASTSTSDSNTGHWIERNLEDEDECHSPQNHTTKAGHPDAILAFSVGGRSCPGAKFAMQEAILLLGHLVKHLRFKPVPGFVLRMELQGILPGVANGMPLRMERRMET